MLLSYEDMILYLLFSHDPPGDLTVETYLGFNLPIITFTLKDIPLLSHTTGSTGGLANQLNELFLQIGSLLKRLSKEQLLGVRGVRLKSIERKVAWCSRRVIEAAGLDLQLNPGLNLNET
ncbi:hypothetical protein ACFE04_001369 [Oxalis oulophora]